MASNLLLLQTMLQIKSLYKSPFSGDFPGGPLAKTTKLPTQGDWVQSLVRELDPKCCNYDPMQPNEYK